MSRPITIDTASWGPFDPTSATDAMCERERHAFNLYLLKRIQKAPKTGSDEKAILVGALMAITSLCYAMQGNAPPDSARDQLHDALDYCWLQCAGMMMDEGALN